jgi:type I restriction enzyme M protein
MHEQQHPSDPQFKEENGGLKLFDYIVANPPSPRTSNGLDIGSETADKYGRFMTLESHLIKWRLCLPASHIGHEEQRKGCILPHGVLQR